MQIRVTQNVGKVWIRRENNLLALFDGISRQFSIDRKHAQSHGSSPGPVTLPVTPVPLLRTL